MTLTARQRQAKPHVYIRKDARTAIYSTIYAKGETNTILPAARIVKSDLDKAHVRATFLAYYRDARFAPATLERLRAIVGLSREEVQG